MDFTKKDARGAAEIAQFCHLRDPETGKHIMDDKTGEPVGVMVLGSVARSVQSALRDESREKLQSAKGKTEETRALEDIQRDLVRTASRLTTEFVNIQRGERDAIAPDDLEWFYDLNMFSATSYLRPRAGDWQGLSFAQQVVLFSDEIGNYLGNGSSG